MQLTQRQIDYCMECGVCTGSCPVSRENPTFSPRQMVKRSIMKPGGELTQSRGIWTCLSCARCSERCPVEIDFPEFIRSYREHARKAGNTPQEAHYGLLQSIAVLQTCNIKQKRTTWATDVGSFRETGDYFYLLKLNEDLISSGEVTVLDGNQTWTVGDFYEIEVEQP